MDLKFGQMMWVSVLPCLSCYTHGVRQVETNRRPNCSIMHKMISFQLLFTTEALKHFVGNVHAQSMLPCCIHLMCIHICQLLLPVLCLLSYIGKCASQGNHLTQSYYLQPAHTLDAVKAQATCLYKVQGCLQLTYVWSSSRRKAGAVSPIQPQSRGCVTNTAPEQGLYHQYSPKVYFIYCNL